MRVQQGPAAPAAVICLAEQGPHQPGPSPGVPKSSKNRAQSTKSRPRGGSWVQLSLPTCLRSSGKFIVMKQVQDQAEKSVCDSECRSTVPMDRHGCAWVEHGCTNNIAQEGTESPGLCLNGGLGPWAECVGGDPHWGSSRPLRIINALRTLTIGSNLSYRCLLWFSIVCQVLKQC